MWYVCKCVYTNRLCFKFFFHSYCVCLGEVSNQSGWVSLTLKGLCLRGVTVRFNMEGFSSILTYSQTWGVAINIKDEVCRGTVSKTVLASLLAVTLGHCLENFYGC